MTSLPLSELRRRKAEPAPMLALQARVRVIHAFVRKTRRYRCYTATARAITGTCLAPYLQEGDCVFVDPTIEPVDGDLVCVMLSYVIEREHFRQGPRGEEVVPDKVARREAIKVLRIVDGVRWVVTVNDGAVRLDEMQGAEIVGTVTAWHRQRWWRRPAMRKLRRLRAIIGPLPRCALG